MKRILKSFVSAFVTVCTCAAIAMPVFATGNVLYGDVNNDGIVSLSDLVSLGKYLQGKVELVNYNVADVNVNYVIDIIDYKLLNDYIVELIPSLPYTS